MNQFSVREADVTEKEDFARLFWKVFEPNLKFEDVLEKDFVNTWNRNDMQEWAYVAEMDGVLRSNVSFFASEDNVIRENAMKIGGVWAVATEKEYRKMGMISAIFNMVFKRMKDEGIVVSLVDPDSMLIYFYERFGFGYFESSKFYELDSDSLRKVKIDADISYHEIKDKKDWYVISQIQKAMSRHGSRVFSPKRHVEYVIESGNCHLLERDSKPVGVVKFSFTDDGNNKWLTVWPVSCFVSLDIFPSIMHIVQKYAAEVQKIRWFCGAESPVLHYTQGPQSVIAKDHGNMMIRVVDFENYCKSIDIPKSATNKCIIKLVDEYCPWNEKTYIVSPVDGKLDVEHTNKEPEVVLDSTNLSRIIGGLTTATILHSLNEIECSRKTAESLEAIFPIDSFFSHYRF